MIPSKRCIDIIKQFEGLFLEAYLCPAGVPTIGYGTTRYPDGSKVKLGEKVNIYQAENCLNFEVTKLSEKITENLNQHQFDAIVSFAYNVGITNYKYSTLRKLLIKNPVDPLIKDEFKKWTKARVNGSMVVLRGLVRRREAEIKLYFNE